MYDFDEWQKAAVDLLKESVAQVEGKEKLSGAMFVANIRFLPPEKPLETRSRQTYEPARQYPYEFR